MSKFYTNVQLIGDTILYRGYKNGQMVSFREKFGPTLFQASKKAKIASKFKTLDGLVVYPVKFASPKEARSYVNRYKDVEDFQIYGYDRFLYQYISDQFPEDEIQYDPSKIKIYSLDIEVESENGFPNVESASEELLCITIKDMVTKKFYSWGRKPYSHNRIDLEYREFKYESEMIRDFIGWWVQNTPDVITGWNVYLYDIPYIVRRTQNVLGKKFYKSYSPWNIVEEKEVLTDKFGMKQSNIAYEFVGISCLDYMNLYQKFTVTKRASYRLDYIATVELGEQKLDHSEFYNFKEFYTKDWQKFVDYNIHDVELIDRLDNKLKLIDLCLTMAYDAKQNYEDVYSQIRTWDNLIFNYLKKKNIVVPQKQEGIKDDKYDGAYVKEPAPGKYEWILSLDLTSMYPSLIMQYSISPETLLTKSDIVSIIKSSDDEELRDKLDELLTISSAMNVDSMLNKDWDLSILKDLNLSMAANGSIYKREKGIFPELVGKIFSERQVFKKKMLEEEANLVKIEEELKLRGVSF